MQYMQYMQYMICNIFLNISYTLYAICNIWYFLIYITQYMHMQYILQYMIFNIVYFLKVTAFWVLTFGDHNGHYCRTIMTNSMINAMINNVRIMIRLLVSGWWPAVVQLWVARLVGSRTFIIEIIKISNLDNRDLVPR